MARLSLTAVEAVLSTVDQTARQAFVYDITLSAMANNLARIAGPPLAGAMIGLLSTAAPFIFLAAAMGLAALLTLLISAGTRQVIGDRASPLRSLAEGYVTS